MLSIIAIGIAIAMFFYGVYVLIKGKIGAGDGKGGELFGWSARKIGLLYMLSPIFSFINVIIFQLFLAFQGASIDEIQNGYEFAYLTVVILTLFIFLFIIVKMSKRIYDKQNANVENAP